MRIDGFPRKGAVTAVLRYPEFTIRPRRGRVAPNPFHLSRAASPEEARARRPVSGTSRPRGSRLGYSKVIDPHKIKHPDAKLAGNLPRPIRRVGERRRTAPRMNTDQRIADLLHALASCVDTYFYIF